MSNPDLAKISKTHRLVLVGVVVTFIAALLPPAFSLIAIPIALYCVWTMTRAIQTKALTSTIYLLLALIPVVNILALISLNIRGRKLLKAGGIKVGLFGVHAADLPTK